MSLNQPLSNHKKMENFLPLTQLNTPAFFITYRKSLLLSLILMLTGFAVKAQPTISYSSPQAYTAGQAITPLVPTSSGVATLGYNTPATLGSGFSSPAAVAFDAAGNIYVADAGNSAVKRISAVDGSITNVGGSFAFNYPTGVAVDAAGNVYVADQGAGVVYEAPVNGDTPFAIGGAFFGPNALALDAAGNLYVTDGSAGTVSEIPGATGSSSVTLGTGFGELTAITVDPAGNIYVVDGSASLVYKLSANNYFPVPVNASFLFPTGVAVDAAGNVFVSDADANTLYEVSPGSSHKTTIFSTFNSPGGIVMNSAGFLYIADTNNNAVDVISPSGGYFINKSLPSGLRFDEGTGTISGAASNASPATDYTVIAYNAAGSGSALVNISVTMPPAPTISYATPQTYVTGTAISPLAPSASNIGVPAYSTSLTSIGSGYLFPAGVAIDKSGAIYIADQGNNAIEKIPAGTSVPVTLANNFNGPGGVAVDAAGNIYVADSGNGQVIEIPIGGGPQITIGSGFNYPSAVAVDALGNVYVADAGLGEVFKVPAVGGTQEPVAISFLLPIAIALDAAGNLYVADAGNGKISELPAVGGRSVRIGGTFNYPAGLTVDASGNIFVSDASVGTIYEIPSGGGSTVTITGFGTPYGLAADGAGNLYVADAYNNAINEVKPTGGVYISPVLPAGLSFNSATGVISGTPTASIPATDFTVNAYNPGAGVSTTLNITVNVPPPPTLSYATPQTFALGVAITPLAPSSTGVASPAYSANPTSVGTGLSAPAGVAVDAAGNVFVADAGNNEVEEIPFGSSTPVVLASGYNSPFGIAVDKAGNVYVASQGYTQLRKIKAGGAGTVNMGSGFSDPTGVAVDAAGNVYVADGGNNAIKKIPAGTNVPVAIGSGFNDPTGVAVDAAGNVYVADAGNNKVYEILVGGGAIVTLGTGFNTPFGVAVDASGNVFISAYGNNQVKEIPADGGAQIIIGSGFNVLFGIATDSSGNVYVADAADGMVKKIAPVGGYYLSKPLPLGLSFDGATGIISGTPTVSSKATNYTVTAYNSGSGIQAAVNINVTSNNANLVNLKVNDGASLSPAFATATSAYTISVPRNIGSMKFTPFTQDSTAVVTVNGSVVASGTASAAIPLNGGANVISVVVTSSDGSVINPYTITVTRPGSTNSYLTNIKVSSSPLSPAFSTTTTSYSAGSVAAGRSSVNVVPFAADPAAVITVNGTTVASGAATLAALSYGSNTITVISISQDGSTSNTYTINVTRAYPANANLSYLSVNNGASLSPAFSYLTNGYNVSVPTGTSTIKVTPKLSDPLAAVKVNNVAVASGTASGAITLNYGDNVISSVVTAQDGTTTNTYTITVTRALPANAYLSFLKVSNGSNGNNVSLSPAFNHLTNAYAATVPNSTSTVTVTPTLGDPLATLSVNAMPATSHVATSPITLNTGDNTITTTVTAQDGTTTNTYTITVTRAVGPVNIPDASLSVASTNGLNTAGDGIVVHQGLSPNGDGVNDYLTIEGIANYPDNKLTIMNRDGGLIYEAKGYDNASKMFDGHSNKDGKMQVPGTYFYSLEYAAKGETKHKTGYIIIKY